MGIYTHAERVNAANISYDAFAQVETALDLLQAVWERNFDNSEQPDICGSEAAIIGIEILAVINFLFEAVKDYHLETGMASSFPGSRRFLELADEYRVYERISSIDKELFDVTRQLPKDRQDAVLERRLHAHTLPDDQAIIALESLLKEAGTQT